MDVMQFYQEPFVGSLSVVGMENIVARHFNARISENDEIKAVGMSDFFLNELEIICAYST